MIATLARLACCALVLAACAEEEVLPRPRVAGGLPERGPALMVAYGCGSCHVIPGVAMARGRVGPSLDDLADRAYLAGAVPNTAEGLVQWIREPQQIRPGGVMPDLGVSERDARDIAAYLYSLRGNRLGPPHLLSRDLLPAH